ncbi:histamine N-methyltransferase-like [Ptychodera flava]|uniref:histamine N-methyltransferase-like n=1 Tax=Ptychodera flava TaxID=63121 RepID=UPI00396AAC2E
MSVSIYEDVEYYFKSYRAYVSKVINPDDMQQLWDLHWRALVGQLPLSNLGEDEEVRMFTIGCGEGFRDSLIVREISKRHPKVYVRALEPAEDVMKLFRDKADDITKSHPGVRFDWHSTTFQAYVDDQRNGETGDEGSFHLVISGHSLYYIDDWACALDRMYDFVRPNGMLAVTIVNGECTFGKLMCIYRQTEGGKMHMLTSDDVSSYLTTKSAQIATYTREYTFDAPEIFDQTSETGNLLLDFFTQRRNFRGTAPETLQDTVLDFLKKDMEREDGSCLFDGYESEVVAVKTVST